jgi:hypothetical protein
MRYMVRWALMQCTKGGLSAWLGRQNIAFRKTSHRDIAKPDISRVGSARATESDRRILDFAAARNLSSSTRAH